MSLFPMPELEPPSRDPSWAILAALLAVGAICIVVVLVVSS